MKSFKRYFSLVIALGLTSAVLSTGLTSEAQAQPYSQTWEESNSRPQAQAKVSSDYTLGWQDTGKASSALSAVSTAAPANAHVEAPVAVNLAELPSLIAAARGATAGASDEVASLDGILGIKDLARGRSSNSRRLRGPSSVSVPTHDITLHADRYYDHYTDNYRYVNKVEVVTYRGGYPQSDTYWNGASYSTYDVYINDLKPGDRYEVRVTWDDGTYRTLERSINRYPDHVVRVSEPL